MLQEEQEIGGVFFLNPIIINHPDHPATINNSDLFSDSIHSAFEELANQFGPLNLEYALTFVRQIPNAALQYLDIINQANNQNDNTSDAGTDYSGEDLEMLEQEEEEENIWNLFFDLLGPDITVVANTLEIINFGLLEINSGQLNSQNLNQQQRSDIEKYNSNICELVVFICNYYLNPENQDQPSPFDAEINALDLTQIENLKSAIQIYGKKFEYAPKTNCVQKLENRSNILRQQLRPDEAVSISHLANITPRNIPQQQI